MPLQAFLIYHCSSFIRLLLAFNFKSFSHVSDGDYDGSGDSDADLQLDADEDYNESGNETNVSGPPKVKADYRDDVTGNVAEILSTNVIVNVGMKGVLAKISSRNLTSAITSTVSLDASASVDRDSNLGDLQVLVFLHRPSIPVANLINNLCL